MSIQSLYQKATRAYLLTQHISASHSCLKAINLLNTSSSPPSPSLRRMIHVLFVNIATSLAEAKDLSATFRILGLQGSTKEDLMNLVWNKVLEGYAGLPGNVDGTVIAVCLLMSMRLDTVRGGQQIAEQWLANVPDSLISELEEAAGQMTESIILSNEDEESAVVAYYQVVELYSVNILTSLQDYVSAHGFIKSNPYLSDQQKLTFDQYISQKEHQVEVERNRKQEEERKAQDTAKAAAVAEAQAQAQAQGHKKRLEQEEQLLKQQSQEIISRSSVAKVIPNGHHFVKPSNPTQRNQTTTIVERISNQFTSHLQQMTKHSTSIGYILFVLLIVGLVRAQRTRLRAVLDIVASKLWETLRMGTKVTFV